MFVCGSESIWMGMVGTFAELDFCAGSMDPCVFLLLLLHPETALPHGDSFFPCGDTLPTHLGVCLLCFFSVCTLLCSVNSVNIHSFVDNCSTLVLCCNGTTRNRDVPQY